MTGRRLVLCPQTLIMKKTTLLVILMLSVMLAGFGCKKSAPPKPQPIDINGIKVDLPAFGEAFSGAAPDLQSQSVQVRSAFRYSLYPKAIEELDKLAAMPGLNDAQKKAVADLTEQVKQVIAKGSGQ